ncbi:MAG: glycosyltransferase family 4 protein [Chloroflexi bacterium]|nr:glycosyltransferase family 4 protein [Chloroflexota bacterium]
MLQARSSLKRRTILSVAYPLAPVSRDATGGAEQVLAMLDDALTRAGHRSVVVACEGSSAAGTLIETPRVDGPLDDAAREAAWEQTRHAIRRALDCWDVDLVHMHGVDFYRYLPPPKVPVLITLHLPPSWYPPQIFRPERPNTFLYCVSAAQQRACPLGARLLPPIENGVPVERLAARVRKRDWAMALGRICPEKGFHLALDAARRADCPLLLGGQVYRYVAHERYYHDEIVPRLDCARRFIGPLGFERKRRLLSAAQCLLAPSLAPETSSLVAMEAMACGTPVIAFRSGALAEIVEDGKTGFLVNGVEEMAQAISAAKTLDPETCRRVARERFSAERMTARYLELYEKISEIRGQIYCHAH